MIVGSSLEKWFRFWVTGLVRADLICDRMVITTEQSWRDQQWLWSASLARIYKNMGFWNIMKITIIPSTSLRTWERLLFLSFFWKWIDVIQTFHINFCIVFPVWILLQLPLRKLSTESMMRIFRKKNHDLKLQVSPKHIFLNLKIKLFDIYLYLRYPFSDI